MTDQQATHDALAKTSLVAANYGNGLMFRTILEDWFTFLGGRPGEVVVVDGGSDAQTHRVYWQMFEQGLIDKLQVIRPDHEENSKDRCFVQEHTAGAIASKPYLLWFKADTLPYRQGHDHWLSEAIEYLDRPEVFAVIGSVNYDTREREAWPGWFYSRRFTENFSLVKRQSFIDAMQEFAGDYIASGFREDNPADATGQGRYLVEVAMERYIEAHDLWSLTRVEDDTWTVFHTNLSDEALSEAREKYLRREDVAKYMNAADFTAKYPNGVYYCNDRPPVPWLKRLRVALGASPIGPWWRAIKGQMSAGGSRA